MSGRGNHLGRARGRRPAFPFTVFAIGAILGMGAGFVLGFSVRALQTPAAPPPSTQAPEPRATRDLDALHRETMSTIQRQIDSVTPGTRPEFLHLDPAEAQVWAVPTLPRPTAAPPTP